MKAKNVCYQHDGRVPIQNLSGALCFDVETEPITALPYYCPFNLAKQEFAWIEEYLQVQIGTDLNKPCNQSCLDLLIYR